MSISMGGLTDKQAVASLGKYPAYVAARNCGNSGETASCWYWFIWEQVVVSPNPRHSGRKERVGSNVGVCLSYEFAHQGHNVSAASSITKLQKKLNFCRKALRIKDFLDELKVFRVDSNSTSSGARSA